MELQREQRAPSLPTQQLDQAEESHYSDTLAPGEAVPGAGNGSFLRHPAERSRGLQPGFHQQESAAIPQTGAILGDLGTLPLASVQKAPEEINLRAFSGALASPLATRMAHPQCQLLTPSLWPLPCTKAWKKVIL